ncbi:MAG: M20/M25/M40 family metallo-hydrolase, partial [Clostridia bacterium]|nr:M20/M25/M40 family metallo-hydrolase [Clostridia bacterium]
SFLFSQPIGHNKNDIVIFMAHTDVVFPDTTPLPFRKDEECFYCPGVGDDTCGVVMLLMVIKYILKNNLVAPCGILFALNSCEEGLGDLKGIKQIMKDYDGRVSAVYTFDGNYTHIVNACVGSHRYEVSFTTEGGHSFNAFGNRNAIAAMSKVICDLYACKVPEKQGAKTTFNVGIVEGGTSVNTIAQNAKMLFEYRSDDKDCLAYMQNYFEKTIEKAKNDNIADIQVNMVGNRPCDGDVDKVKLEQMTQNSINICQKYSGVPCKIDTGSTDCNIPMSLGVPAVCVGAWTSAGTHTREEKLFLKSIPIGLKITAELILEYFEK